MRGEACASFPPSLLSLFPLPSEREGGIRACETSIQGMCKEGESRQGREGGSIQAYRSKLSNTDQSKKFLRAAVLLPSSKYGKVKFSKTKINVQLLKHCLKGVDTKDQEI